MMHGRRLRQRHSGSRKDRRLAALAPSNVSLSSVVHLSSRHSRFPPHCAESHPRRAHTAAQPPCGSHQHCLAYPRAFLTSLSGRWRDLGPRSAPPVSSAQLGAPASRRGRYGGSLCMVSLPSLSLHRAAAAAAASSSPRPQSSPLKPRPQRILSFFLSSTPCSHPALSQTCSCQLR